MELPDCLRCSHPPDRHRLDDGTNIAPTDPRAMFRCVGYDCEKGGKPPPPDICGCPDYVRAGESSKEATV